MKKLLALLLVLTLCATAALAEEGVFDYTVFEENEDIDLEIDRFDESWNATITAWSTIGDMLGGFTMNGTLDGELGLVYLYFVGDYCDEVRVLVDDTIYTFNTGMQEYVLANMLRGEGCIIFLTPETEPFFQTLATAETVDIRFTTVDDEVIDTSIAGSDLEKIQFMLAELFAQDVVSCYIKDGEDLWEMMEFMHPMTVD